MVKTQLMILMAAHFIRDRVRILILQIPQGNITRISFENNMNILDVLDLKSDWRRHTIAMHIQDMDSMLL